MDLDRLTPVSATIFVALLAFIPLKFDVLGLEVRVLMLSSFFCSFVVMQIERVGPNCLTVHKPGDLTVESIALGWFWYASEICFRYSVKGKAGM